MTKSTQTYPTDLNCTEQELLAKYFPAAKRGRPRKWQIWEIMNGILYVNRTGCQWRMLPVNFPPWETVYGYFWRWTRNGTWEKINTELVEIARKRAGRDPHPSAGSIDSQSVKTSEGGEERGVDVHKQTNGRKRHIVVDTMGLLLAVVVHSAGIQDGAGGKLVLQHLFERIKRNVHNSHCRFKLLWADGAYASIAEYVRKQFGWKLEIVRRPEGAKGFTILPRRWVVERSFGWFGRYRRLSRDFEHKTVSSEAMVYLASIRRTLKLATGEKTI